MKKVLVVIGLVAALVIISFMGSKNVGANLDWKVQVENEANRRIAEAGYHKREEIKSKDMSQTMMDAIDPELKRQEDELAILLEEYYQMKLQGLTDSPEFKALEAKLETIKNANFDRYKADIDKFFAGM